jgi:hypothetical protein
VNKLFSPLFYLQPFLSSSLLVGCFKYAVNVINSLFLLLGVCSACLRYAAWFHTVLRNMLYKSSLLQTSTTHTCRAAGPEHEYNQKKFRTSLGVVVLHHCCADLYPSSRDKCGYTTARSHLQTHRAGHGMLWMELFTFCFSCCLHAA